MSKFKVGDKARLTKYYSEFWPEGHEFEVTELVDGGTYLKGRIVGGGEGTITAAWCVPVESELERLVRVANEFGEVRLLMNKYVDQIEYNSGGGWYQIAKWNRPDEYRIKQKPKFEPFTVGSGWTVKLEGETLHIGCKTFDARELKSALGAICRDGFRGWPANGSSFKFICNRNGVSTGDQTPERISWADADKILAALEKAGIK